ncbi:hypothetical protein EDD21DRAFT_423793 [Dissophora ornata]|nr:hypothetical protein EDD21DRAFT_423793 [Dissophora ornata]
MAIMSHHDVALTKSFSTCKSFCTLVFAISIVSVTAMSMFVYGPIFCLCLASAFSFSVLYNFGVFLKNKFSACWNAVRDLKDQVLGSSARCNDSGQGSMWSGRATPGAWSPPPSEKADWDTIKNRPFESRPVTSSSSSFSGALAGHGGRKGVVAPEQSEKRGRAQRVTDGARERQNESVPYFVK